MELESEENQLDLANAATKLNELDENITSKLDEIASLMTANQGQQKAIEKLQSSERKGEID